MWECPTNSNAHPDILLADLAPDPASLESKQERASSDQQAIVLLYPTIVVGPKLCCNSEQASFLKVRIPNKHCRRCLIRMTFTFSWNMSADPDCPRHFDVIQNRLSSRPYFRMMELSGCRTRSTQLIALLQRPTMSLKFILLMVIHPCMPPQ